jgi:hypothetical protein
MNNNLQAGQFYRNAANRYFKVESLTETAMTLQEHGPDGPSGKMLNMGRGTFEAMLKNKNYDLAKSYGYDETRKMWREKARCMVTEGSISANRFLV